jgi:hypothetical protein
MIEVFPLASDYEYYLTRKAELLGSHAGEFALVKDRALAGVFGSEAEAYREGLSRFGVSPFLIVPIQEREASLLFLVEGGLRGRRWPLRQGRLVNDAIVEVDIPLPE